MRNSTIALALATLGLTAVAATLLDATLRRHAEASDLRDRADLVRRYGLTDLCLFTEARYTRHLSQTDLHAPFQDHPVSLDHFPSGSLVGPPPGWRDHD